MKHPSIPRLCWICAMTICWMWGGLHCAAPPQDEQHTEQHAPDSSHIADNLHTEQKTETGTEPAPDTLTAQDSSGTDDRPADHLAADQSGADTTATDSGTTDSDTKDTTNESTSEAAPEATPEVAPEPPTPQGPRLLLVGQSTAITSFQLETATGKITQSSNTSVSGAIRFLAFHPNRKWVYAVNQTRVEAFAIQAGGKGALKAIGSMVSGEGGTHLDVDHSGKYVFVASYGGNQVSMLPLAADGKPQKPTYQEGGKNNMSFCVKAHQARVHSSNQFVYVPCLGSDHILVLGFDASTGKVTPKPVAQTPKGAGPRHLDFHPNKRFLYVVNELKSSVLTFQINQNTGQLTQIQELTTLPKGVTAPSKSSDIHVSPDGKMVFAVNREPLNNIAMFAVAADGKLSSAGHISTGGEHARSFAFGPNGQYLYVGNTNSKSLVVLKQNGNQWPVLSTQTFPTNVWFVGHIQP